MANTNVAFVLTFVLLWSKLTGSQQHAKIENYAQWLQFNFIYLQKEVFKFIFYLSQIWLEI